MAKAPAYPVTLELSEMELALLYHTVMEEREEYRTVLWKGASGSGFERHHVSQRWLEKRVFGRIAEMQPEWLTAMEEARKRLALHAE